MIMIDCNITLFQIATLIIATITAYIGLSTYISNQKWKKAEYVANLVDKFKKNRDFKRATLMLDWTHTEIPVYENEIEGITKFAFTSDMIIGALNNHVHINNEERETIFFNNEESLIRHIFDEFFESLETIYSHISKGVYKLEDIDSYIIYWVKKIDGNSWENPQIKESIYNFLDIYEYVGVKKLINQMRNEGLL